MRMKYIQNIIVAVMMLGLSITSSFFLSEGSFIGNVVGRNLASLSLCIIVILILVSVSVGNKMVNYMGKISYEIFLIHPFVIGFFATIECEL